MNSPVSAHGRGLKDQLFVLRNVMMKTFSYVLVWLTLNGCAAYAGAPAEKKAAASTFQPTWESLASYQCPEWFRDAKFGIWAHWGPQAVPMVGDWYAKNMYVKGAKRDQYTYHQQTSDLLYSDGALPFGEVGRSLLAHYYNTNRDRNGGKLQAVYTLKDWRTRPGHGDYIDGIGVQDVERGGLSSIKPAPWQTDTSIGDWYYNKNWKAADTGTMYRSPKWVIHTLVDVVSKNGNMLLNVIQRPDGSLDPDVEQLLATLAAWMKPNAEAIHATRPWVIHGEGNAKVEAGHFKEDFAFSADDVRFTQAKDGRTLYAIALGWPADGQLRIKSLGKTSAENSNKIERVELLGHSSKLAYKQTADGLLVTLPSQPISTIACALKIRGQSLRPSSAVAP